MSPYLHDGILGGEDARWYSSVVADHLEQWRLGMGPVFVGQGRFAANGEVMPLRVAPYLQHFTVALDFATCRRLSPFLLLNLAIFISGVAAGLSAYLCLVSILPSKRWEALLLAGLYLGCPGVLGLVYTAQMFMSFMALPYIPIVFLGIVRIFDRDDFSGWAMVAAGCGACWLAHSPIGLWVTISAALALTARWAAGTGWDRRNLARSARACLLFLGLAGYVFVSVMALRSNEIVNVSKTELLRIVRVSFPASLKPISAIAGLPTDIQLGWGIWAVLLLGFMLVWTSRSKAAGALAFVAVVLVCLALPVPGANRLLWQAMPQALVNATNAVPMQRLYGILAACSVTLVACTLARRKRGRISVLLLLGAAVCWSGAEMLKLRHRGALITNSKAASEEPSRSDNLLMTRFSYGMLGQVNRFFSDGVVNFELEQRVLGPDAKSYVVTDVGAIAPGHDFGQKGTPADLASVLMGSSRAETRDYLALKPTLTLKPGEHYLLALDFPDESYRGVLQISGDGFHREYSLPVSGGEFAFGSTKLSSRVIPLWTTAGTPQSVALQFVNGDPERDFTKLTSFARYELIRYEPKDLPVRLVSLLPLVAEVRSPVAGWYESFRYFVPGWSATVDGRPVAVRRSWNGLVAVPVGAGSSEVRITYRPPLILLTSYWLTWAVWAGLLAVSGYKMCQAAPTSSRQETGPA